MSTSPEPQERRDDLFADRALFGLVQGEQAELEELAGDSYEAELAEYDRTLAALQTALVAEHAQEPPSGLEERLLEDAQQFFAGASASEDAPASAPVAPVHSLAERREASAAPGSTMTPWLAAAAALLLAVMGWWPSSPVVTPTSAEQYEAMVSAAPQDMLRLDWLVLEDASTDADATSGEIVWSDERQEGYMVFRGLASNDASAEQYQLWIFDRNQSDAHPIDGGVFDVPAGVDEVIVPINAKIDVSEAWQFAVTVEQPGGVVVSDRSRLPLLATTQG